MTMIPLRPLLRAVVVVLLLLTGPMHACESPVPAATRLTSGGDRPVSMRCIPTPTASWSRSARYGPGADSVFRWSS